MQSTFMNTKSQAHLLIFVLDASDSVFLTSSPLKVLGGHVESLWNERIIVCALEVGHMTKTVAMPIYGKFF